MKFYALLAAFAAVSIAQTEGLIGHDAESLKNSVDQAKESLMKHKSVDLKNAKDNLIHDFGFRQQEANDMQTASVGEVRKDFEAAQKAGKDTAACKEALNKENGDALDKQLAGIENCFNENSPDFDTFEPEVDAVLKKGNELQPKLDKVVEECKNSTFQPACTIPRLFSLKFSVKSWRKEAERVINSQKRTISNAKSKISKCFNKLSAQYKKELNSINEKARQCLAKLGGDGTMPTTVGGQQTTKVPPVTEQQTTKAPPVTEQPTTQAPPVTETEEPTDEGDKPLPEDYED